MPPENNSNSANGEYKKWAFHAYKEIERLSNCYESLREDVQKIHITLAELKTEFKIKASLFGGLAGSVPVLLMIAIKYLTK